MVITDVQGINAFLAPAGTSVTSIAEIETALLTAKEIKSLQALGDVAETRASTTYSSISDDEVEHSLGTKIPSDISIELLFDPDDILGQGDIISAFHDKTRRQCILVLNDKENESVGSSPSYRTFQIGISGQTEAYPKDGAIGINSTCKVSNVKRFARVTV